MQHAVGQPGQAMHTGPIVEIGQHRRRAERAPGGGTAGIAQHGIDAIAMGKAGENAAGDVPAADNQEFLHAGIVAAGWKA